MKTKVIAFCLFLGLFYLSGCEDTIDSLGAGIQPDGNKIEIYDLSLNLTGETIKLDSIYAKSINGLLGNVNHPAYGSVQGGYACQFYPSAEFVLDSMLKSEIDSIQLKIMYFNYLGDSLAPMEVSVFPLNKALEENYYTNVDLTQYADMQSILGKRAYTARNLNITDSINEADYEDQKYKVLSVTLPKELGQSFFDEYKKEGDGVFVSQEAFTKYFPGVYINPTFGSGCLLDVEKTAIYIYYERKWQYYNSTSEKDTIVEGTAIATLNVTKEVVQLNSYTSSGDEKLLAPNPDKMYLKTPAGVYSKITIPLDQIIDSIGNRKFSNAQLTISAYPREEMEYPWEYPGTYKTVGLELAKSKLLLIEQDSVIRFFESQKAADNLTSYYATFNSSSNAYVFKNISNVLQNAINNAEDDNYKDLELVLIPVTVPYYYSSDDYYNTSPIDYATYHYLYPSAITLKKGGENLKLEIIAADLEVNTH